MTQTAGNSLKASLRASGIGVYARNTKQRLQHFRRGLRAAKLWRAARTATATKAFTLSPRPCLIIAPHHDDETFGCGGLIAAKRASGVPVTVAFITNGQRCFGDMPDNPDALERLREGEAKKALAHLDVPPDRIHFLSFPDAGLRHMDENQRTAAVDKIAALMEVIGSGEVYVPHHRDRHADHEAAHLLTRAALVRLEPQAFTLIEYCIWYFWEAPPDAITTLNKDMSGGAWFTLDNAALQRKRLAIAEYHSQIPLLPKGFIADHSRPLELFITPNPSSL